MILHRVRLQLCGYALFVCLGLVTQAFLPLLAFADILVTQQRPYGKEIHRLQAEAAAFAAAEVEAYERAALFISQRLLHQKTSEAEAPDMRLRLRGMARMLYSGKISEKKVSQSETGHMATVTLTLTPQKKQAELLKDALVRQDLIEMYSAGAEYQTRLLTCYDKAAEMLYGRNMRDSGGKKTAHELEYVVGQMRSMQKVFPLIAAYGYNLPAPGNIRGQMAETERHTPGNPLVGCALAEYALQDDDSFTAMKIAAKAIATLPGYARVHNVMGTTLLKRFLPKKALQSFTTAVSLSPHNPVYYRHRAMARLVLHDTDLCSDVEKACALGDCAMLEWTISAGKCGGKQTSLK
ncbi:hypothetical protein LJC46_00200 [Desulfovibrio sp. OttesenSCG-928-G15]|nr:hypothetical protein [Desulfovibrio sp. OttesenSCG-928-G15]